MAKEIEGALERVREKLPKIFEGEAEPVSGMPTEICVEKEEFLHGVMCFGYTVKHEVDAWGISVCMRAKAYLSLKWGGREVKSWDMDSCASYREIGSYKSPLDLFRKLNRVFLCAVERPKPT